MKLKKMGCDKCSGNKNNKFRSEFFLNTYFLFEAEWVTKMNDEKTVQRDKEPSIRITENTFSNRLFSTKTALKIYKLTPHK